MYRGGGTYFAHWDMAVRPDMGQVLSFPGKVMEYLCLSLNLNLFIDSITALFHAYDITHFATFSFSCLFTTADLIDNLI